MSEGSVRDALSLLDRGLLTLKKDKELDLNLAQKIFGYFDKSQLIDIFEIILKGDEKTVIEKYRSIYDQGVDPKAFINDFLELIYYFKNINSLTIESTNFSLNDQEFQQIKKISGKIDSKLLILFWQFTIKTLEELETVSNQNLSIEMLLIRLIHLNSSNTFNDLNYTEKHQKNFEKNEKKVITDLKIESIDQIKNITQEKKVNEEAQIDTKSVKKIEINSFKDLLDFCGLKKEIKLKYELEKNVNLVSFNKYRIEISFNDNLDKNFVKDLSLKLFEWTGQRWIISFSKEKGQNTIKEKENNAKQELINKAKNSDLYKNVLSKFSDAALINVGSKNKDNE